MLSYRVNALTFNPRRNPGKLVSERIMNQKRAAWWWEGRSGIFHFPCLFVCSAGNSHEGPDMLAMHTNPATSSLQRTLPPGAIKGIIPKKMKGKLFPSQMPTRACTHAGVHTRMHTPTLQDLLPVRCQELMVHELTWHEDSLEASHIVWSQFINSGHAGGR